jgi:hypothetical protein
MTYTAGNLYAAEHLVERFAESDDVFRKFGMSV